MRPARRTVSARARTAALVLMVVSPLGACGEADAPDASSLPVACQAVLDGLWLCGSRLPTPARSALLDTVTRERTRWEKEAKRPGQHAAALEAGCRQSLEELRTATRNVCAGIAWAPAPPALPPPPKPLTTPGGSTPDAGAGDATR